MAESQRHTSDSRHRVHYLGLIIGLLALAILAAGFTIAAVQLQSGVAAYLTGEGNWSRGQIKAVYYLSEYARSGDPETLERARRWYDIPLGDLQARKAMEGDTLDYSAAYDGFIRGRLHPSDIPRMIWVFRIFSNAPYFRDAVEAWENSDRQILLLGKIADELEKKWQANASSAVRLEELRKRLAVTSEKLDEHAKEFRSAMSRVARLVPTLLSLASIVFFIVFAFIAMILTRRLTRALRRSEKKFRATFEQAGLGIAQMDEEGCLLEVNPALCQILRYSREKLQNLNYLQLLHPDDKEHKSDFPGKVINEPFETHKIDLRMFRGDGEVAWVRVTLSSLSERTDANASFLILLEDISESQRISQELSYQASHDELTGLINRRAFEGYLKDVVSHAKNEGSFHALCFIDLDEFKIINDTTGHFVGDKLLQQVAEILSRYIRKGDVVARIGGDEFAMILQYCDPDTAVELVDKLRQTVMETQFVWEENSFNIGCSIGIVPISSQSIDTFSLLRRADAACYKAKEQGRNRVYLVNDGN